MQETPDDGALSFSKFSTSILYPNSLQAESEDMLFTNLSQSQYGFPVRFLDHPLAHSNIPIKISVALDEEYQLFTVPVIEVESCYSRESFHFNNSWLLTLMDTVTPEWTWGRDAFWYAFVAANPDFPNGKWASGI
ncbi:hypothetical protein BD769DRAFT_1391176 [Suillus cothurnatus]|nr:hypothetical protein BD769DRAFT_1391176 [Suillus cothurnatus]